VPKVTSPQNVKKKTVLPWNLEHQYSLIECFHPPDDYNTEVADNLAMVDVGTADDAAAAAAAAAGDGDAVVQCGHLQGVGHLLDCDLQNITENTTTLNVFKNKKHVTSLRVQYATGCDVFSAYNACSISFASSRLYVIRHYSTTQSLQHDNRSTLLAHSSRKMPH